MERETGIEPASLAWKAKVLPLNYSRPGVLDSAAPPQIDRQTVDFETLRSVVP